MKKRKPKFKIGQVVAIPGMDASNPPFESIQDIELYEGEFQYNVESGYFQEEDLRQLTRKEMGQ